MVWNMNIPYNAKKCQNIVKIFKNFLSKIGGLSVHARLPNFELLYIRNSSRLSPSEKTSSDMNSMHCTA